MKKKKKRRSDTFAYTSLFYKEIENQSLTNAQALYYDIMSFHVLLLLELLLDEDTAKIQVKIDKYYNPVGIYNVW